MKKIVRLTESDLSRLVNRIIKEEENIEQNQGESEGQDGDPNKDSPTDVKKFLGAFREYFLNKYPQFVKRINTKNEKALLIAAMAQLLKVDASDIARMRSQLNTLK